MTSMAITDPAHGADDGCELAKSQRRRIHPDWLPRKFLTFVVAACATALAACARDTAQHELEPVHHTARAAPVCPPARPRIYSEVRRAEPRSRRPDPALLEPQLAPSCEFKRADIKAVDPDEWARLRSEYERQCYLDAERLARERLGQLQDAVR
jgi:hypothetical protein